MNSELATHIALVGHGNAFLDGHVGEPTELLGRISALSSVQELLFRFHDPDLEVEGSAPWFAELRKRGAKRLRFIIPSWEQEPNSAGFSGGVVWAIEVEEPRRETWSGSWELDREGRRIQEEMDEIGAWLEGDAEELEWFRNPPDIGERPWYVIYESRGRESFVEMKDVGLDRAAEELNAALLEIEDFCRRQRLRWIRKFARARRRLRATRAPANRYTQLLPAQAYGFEARRLLAAVFDAWVFAGMGSWSDQWFGDDTPVDREYKRVTKQLWAAALTAAVAACAWRR